MFDWRMGGSRRDRSGLVNQTCGSGVYRGVTVTNGEIPAVVVVDFESFYVQTGRRMLSLAYSLTGNWSDAEDLVQQAFIAAHRRWQTVGGYDDPAAWVCRVITNSAFSRWRRLGREVNLRKRLTTRTTQASVDTEPLDETLWEAVRRLPRQQSVVVALFYVDDLSVEAIATLLGCATGTVKTQLFRARRRLGERLGAPIVEERDV